MKNNLHLSSYELTLIDNSLRLRMIMLGNDQAKVHFIEDDTKQQYDDFNLELIGLRLKIKNMSLSKLHQDSL